MKSTISLFKAVPIKIRKKKNPSKELLEKTIAMGFVFAPEVVYNYSKTELYDLIKIVECEAGLSAVKMNAAFHKSWNKVATAPMLQLLMEQLIHYITTYGFDAMGIYSEESVYIPNERLDVPELKNKAGINLVVIKGLTVDELKEKVLKILRSGIALKEQTSKDLMHIIDTQVKLTIEEVESIKNKELKIMFYDKYETVPSSPVEFLRYVVYKSTGKTLLIKDKETVEKVKVNEKTETINLFRRYRNANGFERLAEVFNRFKPIFLAFKTNQSLNGYINKISKLSKTHHKAMSEDYLNNVTANIKKESLDLEKLKIELKKVNIFRKIRLAYALKYRTKDVSSILYKIRNGKGFATSFKFDYGIAAIVAYRIVQDSIIEDMAANVKGKKIYIPKNVTYAVPATEKQFTGQFPSGSYVVVPKDMIFGIHWENTDRRIDLDLSLMNISVGKIGWDSYYRSDGGDILFSGDVTDAPKPKGASELFYVKKQADQQYLLSVNFYNFEEDTVSCKIVIAQEERKNIPKNYMVNPNNVVGISNVEINQKQKILGLLVTTAKECRFYFSECNVGGSITSSNTEFMEHSRKYIRDFYKNTITLNSLLVKAGAILVEDKEDCDVDLSCESLSRATIIGLLV